MKPESHSTTQKRLLTLYDVYALMKQENSRNDHAGGICFRFVVLLSTWWWEQKSSSFRARMCNCHRGRSAHSHQRHCVNTAKKNGALLIRRNGKQITYESFGVVASVQHLPSATDLKVLSGHRTPAVRSFRSNLVKRVLPHRAARQLPPIVCAILSIV